jgi:hypothetical protein
MTCYCVCFTIERCKSKNFSLLILFQRDTHLLDLRLQAPRKTLLISQKCTTPYHVGLLLWPSHERAPQMPAKSNPFSKRTLLLRKMLQSDALEAQLQIAKIAQRAPLV